MKLRLNRKLDSGVTALIVGIYLRKNDKDIQNIID